MAMRAHLTQSQLLVAAGLAVFRKGAARPSLRTAGTLAYPRRRYARPVAGHLSARYLSPATYSLGVLEAIS